MSSKNRLFIFIECGLFLYLTGCQSLYGKEIKPFVIQGLSSPESVIFDKMRGSFFVSNVGERLEPSKKDSDGFISELSPKGIILSKKYLPGEGVLHAPKGMAIIGRELYVTDIDKIVGFNIDSRKKTFELDLSSEHTRFLNDLTVFDEKTLLVSATDIGKIYKVSLEKNGTYTTLIDNIIGVNGLHYEKETKELFVVSFGGGKKKGMLGVISFGRHSLRLKKLTKELGALDGVVLLPSSKVMFSDWVEIGKPGLIRVYDLLTKKLSTIKLSESVIGPADFFFDRKHSTIWLPKMMEGKILVESIRE